VLLAYAMLIVPLLLQQDGNTPLMNASASGQLEVVEKLLGAGADVSATNKASVHSVWLTGLLHVGGMSDRIQPHYTVQRREVSTTTTHVKPQLPESFSSLAVYHASHSCARIMQVVKDV
jgi:hypothetical protein